MGLQITSRPLLYNYYVSALNWSLVPKALLDIWGNWATVHICAGFLV